MTANEPTQDKAHIAQEKERIYSKVILVEPGVHTKLRRRVAAEHMMGREQTMSSLATALLTRALDDLPKIPDVPPAV